MKHIAILGECMIELNGKPFGDMVQTFGGDTLNAAVYLSRSCAMNDDAAAIKTSYVTALGTDPISEGMMERWRDEGIETALVLRDPERTPGLYLIQLDDMGERTFLYWRNQSAARYMLRHEGFPGLSEKLSAVDMVFVSGISLAILPDRDRGELLASLQTLSGQGVELAFDSNFRPALWPSDDGLGTVRAAYEMMYQVTGVALVTFDDEQLIWGDATPQDTLARLRRQGVKKAVVKLGEEGCIAQDFTAGAEPVSVPTQPVAHVVDTTSAGDSFNGGFLSAYLTGNSLEFSCQRGNALAGLVIGHRGAIVPKSVTDELTGP